MHGEEQHQEPSTSSAVLGGSSGDDDLDEFGVKVEAAKSTAKAAVSSQCELQSFEEEAGISSTASSTEVAVGLTMASLMQKADAL